MRCRITRRDRHSLYRSHCAPLPGYAKKSAGAVSRYRWQLNQIAAGFQVPSLILDRMSDRLPSVFQSAAIARAYNLATGATLSHLDVESMGMFERQELILLAHNTDLLSGPSRSGDRGDDQNL